MSSAVWAESDDNVESTEVAADTVAESELGTSEDPTPVNAQPEVKKAQSIALTQEKKYWGIGIRGRNLIVPKSFIENFVERAASGLNQYGYGIEVIRRKRNLELTFGVEYDNLNLDDGIWIEKGESIPQDEPDLVEFDGFGWVAVDFNAIWHIELHKMFSLRVGAGIGLGVVLGDVLRTDYICTTSEESSCSKKPNAEQDRSPEEDIPPVFPLVDFIVGVQFRPLEKLTINLEAGTRSVPYLGASIGYYF